ALPPSPPKAGKRFFNPKASADMANNYCVSFLLFFTALISLLPKSYPESTNQYSDEHQILLGLKRYWGSSTVLGRWNSISSDHCRWGGLTCTKGEVTAISLPQQTLMKPIPPSLCLLKNLAYLDLSYNNFSTSFPTILYNCSNLKYLDLSNNAFGGKLAADINSLSAKLEHLNLSSNRIMGEIPPSIGWFPKLKSLILDTNQFDGSYPVQDISNLANLEMLTLADNPFLPAPFPVEFGKLTRLTYLWLSEYNVLSGLCEMNWIGSGRSGNVYRICVVDGEGGSRMVAVKKIWNAQNLDNKLEKDFLAESFFAEYGYRLKVNEKVDVYSFGVLLLELTTGRVANDGGLEYCLAEWAWRQYQEYGLSIDLLDEDIRDPANIEDAFAVFTLGVICTGGQPSVRPSMKDVLYALLRFEHKSRERSLQHAVSEETSLLES
uniref:Leucine-rich repeat-containing N-terminal plant-type domain-containing protein n=1 Tax=Aegilops tauschii subsp. strangulata TaxID=200361 RepID=A0A453PWD8_AEGTS